MKKKNALIIGGTGMLRKATLWIAHQDYQVIATGRNTERLKSLHAESKSIQPLKCDYSNSAEFRDVIAEAVKGKNIQLVVAWIHQNEKAILRNIAEIIKKESGAPWKLYHVLGSSSDLNSIRKNINPGAGCDYYQIQLGFKKESGYSRWLSNEEISDGVIESIQKNKTLIVGQLEPWEDRP